MNYIKKKTYEISIRCIYVIHIGHTINLHVSKNQKKKKKIEQ